MKMGGLDAAQAFYEESLFIVYDLAAVVALKQ
jgi:hypothetical protein